jgi:hypothetical protein
VLTETGAPPDGVTFTDDGDGTATLAGTPAAGTARSHVLTVTAHNGAGSDATQTFTLTVEQAPAITSGAGATFTVGSGGAFTVTAIGSPTPSLSEAGALPAGVTFTDDGDGTATLAGAPAPGTNGTYLLTVAAHNGAGSDATQMFSLVVSSAAPPPPPIEGIRAQLVLVKAGKKKRLMVEVFFADTGALKGSLPSPFRKPAFKNIHVSVVDGNGDGVPDEVILTARKGKKTVTTTLPG